MHRGTFHRWLLVSVVAAILYGRAPALASETPQIPSAPASAQAGATQAEAPHIALLLPLSSSAFGRHADAVRNGFFGAAKVQGGTPLPLRIYAVGDDTRQIVEGYRKALSAGARLVVGPLTRNGVTAIADGPVPVPTLALNVPEGNVKLPANLYLFSLQAEAEARQVARLAYLEGRRNALTVSGDTQILKRIHQAFVEEFSRLGGAHVSEFAYTADPAALSKLKQLAGLEVADMAFLALDFSRARLARPYLDPLALYATSQVHPSNAGPLAGFDLAGVRFLDMPWLLQPEHPAVMVYPRGDSRDIVELDRFYALGIDAFRIALSLLAGRFPPALDGVTGRITLERDQQFTRNLTAAQYHQGKPAVSIKPLP